MKLCNTSFFLLLLLLFAGCAHDFVRSEYKSDERSYEDFVNDKIKDRCVLIKLVTSEEINACNAFITQGKDSLKYTLLTADKPLGKNTYTLALNKVRSISFSDKTSATLKGMGTGLLIGGAIGSVTLNVDPFSSNSGQHPNAGTNALTGAAIGAVPGAVIGYFIGERYTFIVTK